MDEILDLDAAVAGSYRGQVIAAIKALLTSSPRSIVDLGAGTGTGTHALAEAFPGSTITAVDASAHMIDRITAADSRVVTALADLDKGWPADVGDADVIWASSALHHVADPDDFLRAAHPHLRPGGVLAIIEIGDPPRFLPREADASGPDLQDRISAAMGPAQWNSFPDWSQPITAAGFTMSQRLELRIESTASEELVRRYAQAWFTRIRTGLADSLTTADLTELDDLLDPASPRSLARRALVVESGRTVWLARP